ncbi:AMP-binding protein [Kitasatospora sp. NPDC053057]|uniref:AMP-binding protein n=1 Tax=Kitasatospora sp. NPDC053057 TaxID=3364062 RepID=UPI0037C6D16F
MIAACAYRPAEEPAVRIGPGDDLGIRHTGGTTGIPKGVLSLHGPYRSAFDVPYADPRPEDEPPRLLAATSLAHPAGVLTAAPRLPYGGCAVAPTRIREALKVFGPVLVSGYGMSQARNIAMLGPAEHDRIGHGGRLSVGRPLPGVEVEIRAADGTALPAGEQGEVHVRSATLTAGYWKQPDLTAQVLRHGWLDTGDTGDTG